MQIPKNVLYIIEELEKNNHQAFLVGGSVRDFLMNLPISDFDIATSAQPYQMAVIFTKTINTGAKFGTMTIVIDKESYEVTTFRIDGEYKDNRKPDTINYTTDIIQDLSRRDFTINAIAWSPSTDDVFIDPFDGQSDINKKIVKAVGIPNDRFNEDALRILRCIRFATKLNFNIEEKTYQAVCDNIKLMKNISIERIREELVKTFLSDFLDNLIYINYTNVLKYINIDFYEYLKNNLQSILSILEKSQKSLIIRWAIILYKYDNPKNLLRFFKFSNDEIKQITNLIDQNKRELNNEKYIIKKHILKLDHTGFENLLEIKKSFGLNITHILETYNQIKKNNEPIFINQLDITGDILNFNGIEKGKSMGIIINKLHDIVLMNPDLNKQDYLIGKAKEIL